MSACAHFPYAYLLSPEEERWEIKTGRQTEEKNGLPRLEMSNETLK
jgi:hypothetical protein